MSETVEMSPVVSSILNNLWDLESIKEVIWYFTGKDVLIFTEKKFFWLAWPSGIKVSYIEYGNSKALVRNPPEPDVCACRGDLEKAAPPNRQGDKKSHQSALMIFGLMRSWPNYRGRSVGRTMFFFSSVALGWLCIVIKTDGRGRWLCRSGRKVFLSSASFWCCVLCIGRSSHGKEGLPSALWPEPSW